MSDYAPTSEAELADLIAGAESQRFRIAGGGTRRASGAVQANATLSVSALKGITLYEPGALTLVAAAGTPMADIDAALEAEGQMLAFEPMDHRSMLGTTGTPTLGGVVAMNASGPRRIQSGAARDAMLGVRFVDGMGRIVKNGGRVMKNVTGYDLVKLMTGSHGTLGVLTEVSVKVLPKPEAEATIRLAGLSEGAAVRTMSDALTSPFDVSGAAHDPGRQETYLRLEGFEASVRYRAKALLDRLSYAEGSEIVNEPSASRDIWLGIRDVTALAGEGGDVWHVSVKPSDGPGIVAKARQTLSVQPLYDWGGGRVWLRVPEGEDLRAALGAFQGHATRIKGTGTAPAFHPEPAVLAGLSSGLRRKFDPEGRLNPGLMQC